MEAILENSKRIFSRSPRPFGIAHVTLNEDGTPADASIEYCNQAMAALVNCAPEDIIGKNMFEIWSVDNTDWLDSLYRAAYKDESVEFEAVSIEYLVFQNCSVFPIVEGYCGYEVIDVTSWLATAHPAMKNVSAGMFFYDRHTKALMLSDPAKEFCSYDSNYITLDQFVEMLFDPNEAAQIKEAFETLSFENDNCIFEEQTKNGGWLRISATKPAASDKFAIGFIEDIALLHDYETRDVRRSRIIESLSTEYYALYIVNLDDDTIAPYLFRDEIVEESRVNVSPDESYSDWLNYYVEQYVVEADRLKILALLSPESLKETLAESAGDFSISCQRNFGNGERYIELRVTKISDDSDEVVIAARNINEEVKSQILQKNAIQNALVLAEHASDAKTAFLTNISHDFRTPLNSIMGFSDIALTHLDDNEKVEICLQKIMMSSEHLLGLINEVLDVSRIESGSMVLDEEPVNLRELLDEVQSVFQAQAIENGIVLNLDTSALKHIDVMGDQLRIRQILVNIIGNAIKYTPEGGSVSIAASEQAKLTKGSVMFKVVVKDTGIGMSQDFLKRIFEPFEREEVKDSVTEGTGLGMTITKNLVDLMGGTISVTSTKGKGSEFSVLLPLKLDTNEHLESVQKYDDELVAGIRFDDRIILVVDDDDLSREMVSEILKSRGATVEQASNGEEAVEAVKASDEGHFDAIIMDMRMPKMPGDVATRNIRLLPRDDTATLPIIAATADAYEEGHRRAFEAGMTVHITKPIRSKKLVATLSELI